MKHLTFASFILVVCLSLALSACKGAAANPTPDANAVYTQIWQTVEAGKTQTASAATATPEFTETSAAATTDRPTNTPLLTSTLGPGQASVTPASTNTRLAQNTTGPVCDNFSFVSDVTIPDNSVIPGGETFIKTWRIKNLGPCTWDTDYNLAWGWGGDGTDWQGSVPIHFFKKVVPNDTIDLSVELKAPTASGTYSANFRPQNPDGYYFGPTLTVLITVK